ncbi:MAG: precorrin-6y C5,15-methyltransferase (decarboxylating) subunit CbiE [Actinomycetota bacterium]
MHDVAVVGLHGGQWWGVAAGQALAGADVVIGAARHLDALEFLEAAGPSTTGAGACRRVALSSPVDAVLSLAAGHREAGRKVCLLASGDPGFFGIVRLARDRFPVVVHPAPPAVSLAFARLGENWDDAVVVSAHGRPAAAAVEAVLHHPKVAVLTSPDNPPQALGRALVAAGCGPRRVAVGADLGGPGERVTECGLQELAGGDFQPLAVVVFTAPGPAGPTVAWGLPEDRFDHRAGMITKAEVRAVALGKLDLPATGVLWDVGAGSGSVASECARLCPGLSVFAVERRPDDAARARANCAGTAVTVVEGEAPAALAALPAPDRAFVGGGGLDVLDAVLARLRPGGTVVATYAALDRAAAAAARLGNVVQVAVSRGAPVPPGGTFRLQAENPVFVCWGPDR